MNSLIQRLPINPAPKAVAAGRGKRVAARVGCVLLGTGLGVLASDRYLQTFDPLGTVYFRDVARYQQGAIQPIESAVHPGGRLFENLPNRITEFSNFTFETDGFGLREPSATEDIVPSRAADRAAGRGRRILLLGDSVTFGWGVPAEESWAELLEGHWLDDQRRPLRVMNAGHLMYDTTQEVDWAVAHAKALEPDVIAVTLIANDLRRTWNQLQGILERMSENPERERGLRGWARGNFRGLDALRQFVKARSFLKEHREDARPVAERPETLDGWPFMQSALLRLQELCGELECELILLDHATPPVPELAAFCEQHGIARAPAAWTPAEWAQPIRLSPTDYHANALGNRILATKFARALFDQGWLASAEPESPLLAE